MSSLLCSLSLARAPGEVSLHAQGSVGACPRLPLSTGPCSRSQSLERLEELSWPPFPKSPLQTGPGKLALVPTSRAQDLGAGAGPGWARFMSEADCLSEALPEIAINSTQIQADNFCKAEVIPKGICEHQEEEDEGS